MIPDWLQPTFLLLPAMLWMCFGVGIPWALVILPRADWSRRIEVIAVALALGPALTTTALFAIGTVGQWSRANVLIETALIAILGWAIALRQRPYLPVPSPQASAGESPGEVQKANHREPFTAIDGVLILVLGIVIALHFWDTAYWPYDNYDELWVYGANAQIFTLHTGIPASIGYYPQLLPLSLTYGQIMWGGVSEHAARVIVPYLSMGSILITYVLGSRLFGRRVGLISAAIWALYPQASGWAQYADLEIPVTFYFTGAAAYFIVAWLHWTRPGESDGHGSRSAVRYAILAGVFAGAALWTKPTAGALIDSGALIGAAIVIRAVWATRSAWRTQRVKVTNSIRTAVQAVIRSPLPIFALALIPMGSMWYARNILFGYPPLTFPGSYWLDEAQRSGLELGWPLIAIGVLSIYLIISPARHTIKPIRLFIGIVLLLIGALPSAIGHYRLTIGDYVLLTIGSGLWLWSVWNWWTARADRTKTIMVLTLTFIAPYFVTWFWSYSYHYRLSFAMVPLFALLIGLSVDRVIVVITSRQERTAENPLSYTRVRITAVVALIAAVPGCIAALSAWGYVQTNALPDDHAKQQIANPALIALVDDLKAHHPADRALKVSAPGELRLPYFFPNDDIRTDYPTQLDQIADVDFYVDSSVGQRLYRINGDDPSYVQILASLTRDPIMHRQMTTDDDQFRYSVYTVDNGARFIPPSPSGVTPNIQFGSVARLLGYDLSTLKNEAGQKIFLTLYWQSVTPTPIDYSVYVHLWEAQNQKLIGAWGGEPVSGAFSVWAGVPGTHFSDPYHTRLWQPGEYIKDEWIITPDAQSPPGTYELRVGLFDPNAKGNQRLPVTQNGQPIGDGVLLNKITVTAAK